MFCRYWIQSRMINDRLLLNDDKAEMLLIGTQYQLNKLDRDGCLHVGDNDIRSVACARNLGVWFDKKMSMSTHITKSCSSAFFHFHNIRRNKKYLSVDSLRTIVHAFITSQLDYSLMYGLPNVQISKLQRVQNAAARLIMDIPKYSLITPASYELPWLPIAYRIKFKILINEEIVQHDTSVGQRKNMSPRRESNPWPPRYRLGALTNWATRIR